MLIVSKLLSLGAFCSAAVAYPYNYPSHRAAIRRRRVCAHSRTEQAP